MRVAVGLIDLRGKAVEGGINVDNDVGAPPPPTRDDFAVLHAIIARVVVVINLSALTVTQRVIVTSDM